MSRFALCDATAGRWVAGKPSRPQLDARPSSAPGLPIEPEPQDRSDAELVAVLMDPSSRRRGGRPSEHAALGLLAEIGGLAGLARTGVDALTRTRQVRRATARRLVAAVELGRRVVVGAAAPRATLATPEAVAAWLIPRLGPLDHEQMWVLSLDGRNRLKGMKCVAVGGSHGCGVTARDILRAALGHAAAGFVLVHNHPSGESSPSAEDLSMTRAVARAAEAVGIPLVDHVIVASSGSWTSLLEEGAL